MDAVDNDLHTPIALNKELHYMEDYIHDLFNSDKLLINGVGFQIKLTKGKRDI